MIRSQLLQLRVFGRQEIRSQLLQLRGFWTPGGPLSAELQRLRCLRSFFGEIEHRCAVAATCAEETGGGSDGRRRKGKETKTDSRDLPEHADWQQIQNYQNRYSSVRKKGGGRRKEEREVLWQGTREKRTQERGTESAEEHAN